MGLRKLGAGSPTGPALPPGRWLGLGGTCTSSLSSHFQCLLSLRWQSHRSRGYFPGGVSAGLPHLGNLSLRSRWFCHLDDQRDQKFAHRPLSSHQARPADRLARRCYARGREQGILRSSSGSTGFDERVGLSSAIRAYSPFPGITRGCHSPRPPAIGVRRDSAGLSCAGRHRQVSHQSWAHRVGQDLVPDGSPAIMTLRAHSRNLVFLGAAPTLPVGVEP